MREKKLFLSKIFFELLNDKSAMKKTLKSSGSHYSGIKWSARGLVENGQNCLGGGQNCPRNGQNWSKVYKFDVSGGLPEEYEVD